MSSTGRIVQCPILVGRDHLLELFDELIAEADRGRGHALFISGQAGLGKTRLVLEATELAGQSGARTAWATCVADAPAYWPWRQVLRGAVVHEVDS